MGSAIAVRGTPWLVSATGLKPDVQYAITLGNNLVNANADAQGVLSASVPVSTTSEAGFQAAHVIGRSLSRETVDYTKTVFVAVQTDDFDGDGQLNSLDPCPFIDAVPQACGWPEPELVESRTSVTSTTNQVSPLGVLRSVAAVASSVHAKEHGPQVKGTHTQPVLDRGKTSGRRHRHVVFLYIALCIVGLIVIFELVR
jgi:hypothetical protein